MPRPRAHAMKSEILATALDREIREKRLTDFPPVRELAVRRGVSYQTAWQAVDLLRKKKVLITSPGRRTALAGDADRLLTSSERFLRRMREGIIDGSYPAGRRLPKINYFSVTEGLSPATVFRVFTRLSIEGLAHKVRRSWFSGPAPRPGASAKSAAGMPVVLLFVLKAPDWQQVFEYPSTELFMMNLQNELAGAGIDVWPAMEREGIASIADVPRGETDIWQLIHALRGRYRGTLVSSVYREQQRLSAIITRLNSNGKPVFYFDHANAGREISRQSLGGVRGYVRGCIDEHQAARLVLDALFEQGHRTIVIHGADLYDWCAPRVAVLSEIAAKYFPEVKLIAEDTIEARWNPYAESTMSDLVAELTRKSDDRREGNPAHLDAQARSRLLDEGRSFAVLLARNKATAIIALNDRLGWQYYIWCRALGIDLPRHLSLVSFDNEPRAVFYPVSTIDFGCARLGYLAAHVFIDDVPVRALRDGSIPGPCTLVDRGSIGRAGDPAALAAMLRG